MITFFSSVVLTYFITDVMKILLAKQLRKQLNSKNILLIKKGISVVLIISGIVLLAQGWSPKDGQILDQIEKMEKQ